MDIPIIMDKDVTVQVFEAKSEISKVQGIPPRSNATYHKKTLHQQMAARVQKWGTQASSLGCISCNEG